MINAKDVNPRKWRRRGVSTIGVLFDNNVHSIIWGELEGVKTLGIRWNGTPQQVKGYPQQGGNPLWHNVPDYIAEAILEKLLKNDDNERFKNRAIIDIAVKELADKLKTQQQ